MRNCNQRIELVEINKYRDKSYQFVTTGYFDFNNYV